MYSKTKKVIKKIEQEGRFMIVGPDKGKVLVDAVKGKKPKRILEVGTYVGYSAILMADASPNSEIISIEVAPEHAEVALKNIRRAGLEKQIEVIVGDAKEVIPSLSGKFDFMFIDAVKDEYLKYLKLAEDKLERNALVVADNVGIFADSMRDYLNYVRGGGMYEGETFEVGADALEISTKKH